MGVGEWLVTALPSWLLLAGLIVVVAGGAVFIGVVLRKAFPGLRAGDHNDALRFGYGVIAFVYAFFVGFVVSSMWGQINAADALARTEGAAAVQLARDSTAFDSADADRVRTGLVDYLDMAAAEWPVAARGGSSAQADQALQRLYRSVQDVAPRTDIQKTFLTTAVGNLEKISQGRTERLIQADVNAGPSWPLWAVIVLTSGLVLGSAIAFGVENPRMHYVVVLTVGTLVAANLFLILDLSYPYLGDISTSPEALQVAIRYLD
ncbi:MAG: DUF4239 domain-containing protein [Actinomycetota bacterium]|nr:DUF4239 domain-containing protein [Actinomycetota bacterium]MDA2947804.1 DUF4239 domain-containing protein [Actinomycetota bacterium]